MIDKENTTRGSGWVCYPAFTTLRPINPKEKKKECSCYSNNKASCKHVFPRIAQQQKGIMLLKAIKAAGFKNIPLKKKVLCAVAPVHTWQPREVDAQSEKGNQL